MGHSYHDASRKDGYHGDFRTAGPRREIRLIQEEDGWWSAIDERTGVASQGETRSAALDNLDEAVELTAEARDDDTDAPEPDAPWFDT